MASFSIDFNDNLVFDLLGDDFTFKETGETIKVEFKQESDTDELGNRITTIYPTMEIMQKHLHLFKEGITGSHDGVEYTVLQIAPLDERTHEITLRSLKESYL